MSSSEDSVDEEEVLKNFDDQARIIVQTDTLPKKSSERYLLVYNTYKKWQKDNKNLLSNSDENNLVVYFNQLKDKLKPPTLWSVWSMLKKTLNTNDGIDIGNFLNLKCLLKNNAKGYKPKKAFALKWDQIMKFMSEASDDIHLATKVVLIFGVCGALRCDELTNMKVKDVEELDDKYLVSIQANKNDYPGQFIIGNLFYDKVKKYIMLRPDGEYCDRFFLQFHNGKCIRQPIGKHKIGEMPEVIAKFLNLENAKRYTGHCFRRTSATLLSESGANMQMIKQLGRWRSDMIAQGYIENSILNRQMIFEGITRGSHITNPLSRPSTSTTITNTCSKLSTSQDMVNVCSRPSTSTNIRNVYSRQSDGTINTYKKQNESINNYDLDGIDFSEDFTEEHIHPNTSEVEKLDFTTASNTKISVVPQTTNTDGLLSIKRKLFLSKSPVKLNFNSSNVQHRHKKAKILEENIPNNEDGNQENISSNTTKEKIRFENCTFNNCVINSISCKCENKKEN